MFKKPVHLKLDPIETIKNAEMVRCQSQEKSNQKHLGASFFNQALNDNSNANIGLTPKTVIAPKSRNNEVLQSHQRSGTHSFMNLSRLNKNQSR